MTFTTSIFSLEAGRGSASIRLFGWELYLGAHWPRTDRLVDAWRSESGAIHVHLFCGDVEIVFGPARKPADPAEAGGCGLPAARRGAR